MSNLTFWLMVGFWPGVFYRAVPGRVGGLGAETRHGRARGFLVAQPAGGHGTLVLCDFPTRPGDHRRPRDGAGRLYAEPDAGEQGQAQKSIGGQLAGACVRPGLASCR